MVQQEGGKSLRDILGDVVYNDVRLGQDFTISLCCSSSNWSNR